MRNKTLFNAKNGDLKHEKCFHSSDMMVFHVKHFV